MDRQQGQCCAGCYAYYKGECSVITEALIQTLHLEGASMKVPASAWCKNYHDSEETAAEAEAAWQDMERINKSVPARIWG